MKELKVEVNLINPIITINQINTAKLRRWEAMEFGIGNAECGTKDSEDLTKVRSFKDEVGRVRRWEDG